MFSLFIVLIFLFVFVPIILGSGNPKKEERLRDESGYSIFGNRRFYHEDEMDVDPEFETLTEPEKEWSMNTFKMLRRGPDERKHRK